jgi:hypothetical protein
VKIRPQFAEGDLSKAKKLKKIDKNNLHLHCVCGPKPSRPEGCPFLVAMSIFQRVSGGEKKSSIPIVALGDYGSALSKGRPTLLRGLRQAARHGSQPGILDRSDGKRI